MKKSWGKQDWPYSKITTNVAKLLEGGVDLTFHGKFPPTWAPQALPLAVIMSHRLFTPPIDCKKYLPPTDTFNQKVSYRLIIISRWECFG